MFIIASDMYICSDTNSVFCHNTPVVVMCILCMLLTARHHVILSFIVLLNKQWGCTPLLRAVLSGHADVARFLLESGSDVHEQTNVSMVEQSCVYLLLVYCSC